MCSTCGCSGQEGDVKILKPGQHDHHHDHTHHNHDHGHHHHHGHDHHHHHHDHEHHHHHEKSIIEVERDILNSNNMMAQRNSGYFEAMNMAVMNLVSSPGSGKTSILETTLKDLKEQMPFSVIEGDQQTTNDANRIDALNVPVIQINTGKGCHLDSNMVYDAVKALKPVRDSILMIENVGNLVCPALFDLGEQSRVVIISTTEGDDKPLKYPDMFANSQVCLINKIDLLPYVNFNVETLKSNALRINPQLKFYEVSATTGEGMQAWYDWLLSQIPAQTHT